MKSQNSHPNGAKHRTIKVNYSINRKRYLFFSLKDLEQSLLKLYSDKCHQQEELEQRYLNEVRCLLNDTNIFQFGIVLVLQKIGKRTYGGS